ncbi:MAG TPA: glycine zipper domain-containing protein [Xanthomonadaceae bacterium]|nr:glycine zipper domain-containing protein [Xanthomonadaceae bacterium]
MNYQKQTHSDVKKDHSIGSGTGAVAGAMTGAVVGSAAGPVGSLVGAVAGGVIGAKAGDSIAEAVNPTEYNRHFEGQYKSAPYYSKGREWTDYQPAYQYGYDTYGQYRGETFDNVESDLEQNWDKTRANSRLAWNEARDAVRDGWHHIERAMPGDADGDGR